MKRNSTTTIRSIAIAAVVLSFISQATLATQAVEDAGMGLYEYAQLSDLGLFVVMWGYNSAWLLINSVLFLGGAFTFFFSMRR